MFFSNLTFLFLFLTGSLQSVSRQGDSEFFPAFSGRKSGKVWLLGRPHTGRNTSDSGRRGETDGEEKRKEESTKREEERKRQDCQSSRRRKAKRGGRKETIFKFERSRKESVGGGTTNPADDRLRSGGSKVFSVRGRHRRDGAVHLPRVQVLQAGLRQRAQTKGSVKSEMKWSKFY